MIRFDDLLRRRPNVADLLREAGVRPDSIRTDRSFSSGWSFDDGDTPVATVWREELADLDHTPWRQFPNPIGRTDLVGSRRRRAIELFSMMVRNLGKPIRVILQSRQDEAKLKTAGSKRRGLDPEPWYSSIDGESVFLQRGSARASPLVSLDGEPMIRREPTYSLRESRPDQVAFRERVSAKSSGRCAMTSAPGEVCDAAHFPWADWRKDNGAHHGALLRKDIHAALDRGLISIDQGGRVSVSTELASAYPAYGELHGTTVPL